jgi:hypothetical protein
LFEALDKTIKAYQKTLESKDIYHDSDEQKEFYSLCRNIPFYLWDYMLEGREAEHNNLAKRLDGRCCFNHLIQLPEKYGIPHNLYPYEYELYSEPMRPKPKDTDDIVTRQTFRHVFVTKATELSITEFLLRFIAWQCVRNDDLKGHRICVVVGPNQVLAITLIKRIRELFLNNKSGYQVLFPGSATEIFLNGCEIKSYPSHHVDAMRGLTNIKFVLLDEADFFPINDATVVRDVAERYIAKSDPFIVMVSTPFIAKSNNPWDSKCYS